MTAITVSPPPSPQGAQDATLGLIDAFVEWRKADHSNQNTNTDGRSLDAGIAMAAIVQIREALVTHLSSCSQDAGCHGYHCEDS